MLTLDPSVERAYAYGTQHFDAARADDYDIKRAERLFRRVLNSDPAYPFVQHQMARIAFLRGDFATALLRIDAEIETHPNRSSHYMRGLILGFMGRYDEAADDYEAFLREDPTNWAAINDYAWVLLMSERYREALLAADWGLMFWPNNPWLLNSKATAHFELEQLSLADEAVHGAEGALANVSDADWLQAYPGNDPLVASEGIRALQDAVQDNMHTIALAREKE